MLRCKAQLYGAVSSFGSGSHDAGAMAEILGAHPNAGFFCNGEIGPLGDKNCIHTYTASGALFLVEEPQP